MGKVKQINMKNRTYHFYNDQINLKNFYARLFKVDKKDYKGLDIYYIGYATVKKIANCDINSINPLYLMINKMISHFEEKMEINIKFQMMQMKIKKYEKVWDGTKKEIETISCGKKFEYGKDF